MKAYLTTPPRKNNSGITDNMREVAPLAAAPATERSERVGEEAEENRSKNKQLRPNLSPDLSPRARVKIKI